MRTVIGTLTLTLGLLAALSASGWWLVQSCRPGRRILRLARGMTSTAFVMAAMACFMLVVALVQHDFSLRYVADNGGRAVPLYYTIISLWAALQGSLLLWLLILTAMTLLAMWRVHPRATGLHAPAMTVLSAVTTFFFALSLFTSNPFDGVSPVPADGPGPNPLLQDHPLMGVHPPLLYLGYVGMTVPFAYAVAALVTGRTGPAWVEVTRRWTLAAWIFLTIGVVMGGWWAYAVLGWGGYWSWDPVENVSLLPWLTSTALLHSVLVQRRRGTLQAWNLTLATSSFLLVVIGTFLTRSGVVQSVHAFSQSALGPVLLGFVLTVLATVMALMVWRSDRLGNHSLSSPLLSREGIFLANNVLLLGMAFVILLGTVFPLLVEAVNGQRVSVGAPYFNAVAIPAALAVVLLMGVGPLVPWGSDEPAQLARRLLLPSAAGLLTIGVLGTLGLRGPGALLTFGLAALVLVAVATQVVRDGRRWQERTSAGRLVALVQGVRVRRRYYGGMLVHLGFVLAAVAIAASSTYEHAQTQRLMIGDSVRVRDLTLVLTDIRQQHTARRDAIIADLSLTQRGRQLAVLQPALSTFARASQAIGTPAVYSTSLRDAYVTLTEVDPAGGSATVRLAVNPLVSWLWVSSGVMAFGALVAAWPTRPRRRRARPRPRPEEPSQEWEDPDGSVRDGQLVS